MKLYYFTATGNSLQVAKTLKGENDYLQSIVTNKELQIESDAVGLIFPLYNLSIPKNVKEFITKVKIKTPYLFVIYTYGSTKLDASHNILKYFSKNNLTINYLNSVEMLDNNPIFKDIVQEKKFLFSKNVINNIREINKDIKNRKEYINKDLVSIPVGVPARLILRPLAKKLSINKEKCRKCEVCQKVCPTKALDINSSTIDATKCISCLACYHACSSNAILLKGAKNKEHFRNSEVSLQEIINSNTLLTK